MYKLFKQHETNVFRASRLSSHFKHVLLQTSQMLPNQVGVEEEWSQSGNFFCYRVFSSRNALLRAATLGTGLISRWGSGESCLGVDRL